MEAYKTYLLSLLTAQLPTAGAAWLHKQLENCLSPKAFYLAFSATHRFIGKQPLHVTVDQLSQANELHAGFNPALWTAAQAARTLLLLQAPHQNPEDYTALLERLFGTADLSELATLYAALPLLPYPETHRRRAAEGVRTSMTDVFDAIVLDNPYPHDYFAEDAWNQMVLKAVFNARPLHQIYGLDARRNAPLARMLVDYAHERWAAGRTLTPEVWRLVGPYLEATDLDDVRRLLGSDNPLENQAGALALAASDLPAARELLRQHPEAEQASQSGSCTWHSIGEKAYSS